MNSLNKELTQLKKIIFISGFMGHLGEEDFLKGLVPEVELHHFQIKDSNISKVKKELGELIKDTQPDLIYAYSMGGRVLLNLLVAKDFLDKECFLFLESVGLGGEDEITKEKRITLDKERAAKINEDFNAFITHWYDLPMWHFSRDQKESTIKAKKVHSNQTSLLGDILESFSPGAFCSPGSLELIKNRGRTFYLAGEFDEKYAHIAKEVGDCSVVIPNCGHNIHLQRPKEIIAFIKKKVINERSI